MSRKFSKEEVKKVMNSFTINLSVVKHALENTPDHIELSMIIGCLLSSKLDKDKDGNNKDVASVESIDKVLSYLKSVPSQALIKYKNVHTNFVNSMLAIPAESITRDIPEEVSTVADFNREFEGSAFIDDATLGRYMEGLMVDSGASLTVQITDEDIPTDSIMVVSSTEHARRIGLFVEAFPYAAMKLPPFNFIASYVSAIQLFGGYKDSEFEARIDDDYFKAMLIGYVGVYVAGKAYAVIEKNFVETAKDFF